MSPLAERNTPVRTPPTRVIVYVSVDDTDDPATAVMAVRSYLRDSAFPYIYTVEANLMPDTNPP